MVRTRFAPSPTGFLHIGGLRTALYNYLFAKKNKGIFILRIEDTDQNRYVENALTSLLNTLKQVDISYDEGPGKEGPFGPYIQSQRTEKYRHHVQELIEKKAAYHCFCTTERLEEMREKQTKAKQAPMYDRTCLNLSEEEIEQKKQAGIPFVIRQKIPHGRFLKFKDIVRGKITFETSTIDDQVLMKSDHFPTYHLANVVDDHLMEISHVIRGEEWLPSTPKHLLLYEAFGWTPPEFAHVPLLLNKDRSKLSKRQGDVSVESYLEKGYLKEALLNFIALLGWHPGKGIEEENFSVEELIDQFSLEQVHKAGAIFDIEKLDWFNFKWKKRLFEKKLSEEGEKSGFQNITEKEAEARMQSLIKEHEQKYPEEKPDLTIQHYHIGKLVLDGSSMSQKEYEEKIGNLEAYRKKLLLEMCINFLPGEWLMEKEKLEKCLLSVEEKILKNPQTISEDIRFYFEMKEYPVELFINPKMKVEDEKSARTAIEKAFEKLKTLEDFEKNGTIEKALLPLIQELGLKNSQVLWPLRIAITGEQYSPGVFEVFRALGKEESLKRIEKSIEKLCK